LPGLNGGGVILCQIKLQYKQTGYQSDVSSIRLADRMESCLVGIHSVHMPWWNPSARQQHMHTSDQCKTAKPLSLQSGSINVQLNHLRM